MKQEKKDFEELKEDILASCRKGDKEIPKKFAEYCAYYNFTDDQIEIFWKELERLGFSNEGECEDVSGAETEIIEDIPTVPDSVTMQMREIVRIPMLTVERERELSRTIIESRNELTTANLRLVVSIAKKYIGSGMPMEDLFQAGNIGLLKAATRYDYKVGAKFATYAVHWIRQSISKAIAYESRTIRVSEYGKQENRRLKKAREILTQQLQREPSDEELAKDLNWDIQKTRQIRTAFRPITPIHETSSEDGDALIDRIPDPNTPSYEERAERALVNKELQKISKKNLSRQEQMVLDLIRLNYTAEEIAEAAATSVVRVRQVEFGAVRKIGDYRNAGELEKLFRE